MNNSLKEFENIFNTKKNYQIETISSPYHPETFFPDSIYPKTNEFDYSSLEKEIDINVISDNEHSESNKNLTINFEKISFSENLNSYFELFGQSKPKFTTFKINKFIGKKRKDKKSFSFDEFKEKIKKIHSKYDFDNILTKIEVHYINFIINIANDAIKVIFKDKKLNFKTINYKFKSRISYNHFNALKKGPIKRILMEKISDKYKKCESNNNYNVLNGVIKESEWLNKFFNMNFLLLFSKYHNNCKPLKKIVFENKEIKLSRSTKSFHDLLKKYKSLKEAIITIAQKAYFDGKKNRTDNFFVTNINDSKE